MSESELSATPEFLAIPPDIQAILSNISPSHRKRLVEWFGQTVGIAMVATAHAISYEAFSAGARAGANAMAPVAVQAGIEAIAPAAFGAGARAGASAEAAAWGGRGEGGKSVKPPPAAKAKPAHSTIEIRYPKPPKPKWPK